MVMINWTQESDAENFLIFFFPFLCIIMQRIMITKLYDFH